MFGSASAGGSLAAISGRWPLCLNEVTQRQSLFIQQRDADGGVYDNVGLRAFSWLKHGERNLNRILVSDAGTPSQILSDASLGSIGQSVRASIILMDTRSIGRS